VIDFENIEKNIEQISNEFLTAKPVEHVVIDNFCNSEFKNQLKFLPDPNKEKINKSRDYIFANNKFEKSKFNTISDGFNELYEDLISLRFQNILREITKEKVFVDKEFHGGGLHQGGENAFLDMHVDFNYHPMKNNWFRNLNILLYLNENWKPEYRGQLELKHLHNNEVKKIEPIFNRCVIMFTRDYTLHGYKKINFPKGEYRKSIAAYAYSLSNKEKKNKRVTIWYPENSSKFKRLIGFYWPKLVKIKHFFFGSGTEKNK
jgi:hypothetical protein